MFDQSTNRRQPRVPTTIRTMPTSDQLARKITPADPAVRPSRLKPMLIVAVILGVIGLTGGTAVLAKTVASVTSSEFAQASAISRDSSRNLGKLLDQLQVDEGAPTGKLSADTLAAHQQYKISREALAGLPALDDREAQEGFKLFRDKTATFEKSMKDGLGGNQSEFQLRVSMQHPGNELAALQAYLESKAD